MARERIITLRHLSAETNLLSPRTRTAGRGSDQSYLSQSEDDRTAVDYRNYLCSASDCRSPVGLRPALATDGHRPTSSEEHPHHEREDEEEGEEQDENETQTVALMRAHSVSLTRARSFSLRKAPAPPAALQNPFLAMPPPTIQLVDAQGSVAPLDPFNQNLDMGKFMDEVTKISNGIDSIEIDLNDHQSNFQRNQAFRFKLYQKMEQEIIPNLIHLQDTTFISNDEQSNMRSVALHRHPDGTSLLSPHFEDPLKREQINLLASKLNSILYRLIEHLNSEKRMIGNEIKYEWNKELSRCSVSKASRSLNTGSTEDASESHPEDDNSDATNQTLFKLMGLDETGQVLPPSQSNAEEEIHKRLNLAVRSSTSYPQARKSSLIILSEFDQIKQIQIELNQINLLIGLLSQHSLHRPESIDADDDSSSVSFSLDGLDQDIITIDNDEKSSTKEDNLKRKETYKKIRFSYGPKRDILTNEDQEDDNYISKKIEYDLENNATYRYSDLSHRHKSSSVVFHWFSRYRFALLLSAFVSFLLGCTAIGLYFVLHRHDD